MNALKQRKKNITATFSLTSLCFILCLLSSNTPASIITNSTAPRQYCDTCFKSNYSILKQHNNIIDSTAVRLDTSAHPKNGLYFIDSVQSNHFNYYCAKTAPIGHTIVKGYYQNDIPVGVWVKYNDSTDWSFNEYFFFEDGVCMKHVFLFHHDSNYHMDSITPGKDTLIRMHFNTKVVKHVQREYYYIPQDGQFGINGLSVPDLSQSNAYPLDIYNRCFVRREY